MNGRCRYLVLNYHGLGDSPSGVDEEFVVRAEEFARQLDLIRELKLPVYAAGQHSTTLHHETGIAITFDDGNETDFTIALTALKERGLRATFFPVVSEIDKPGKVSTTQIKQLIQEGNIIGSHGLSHRELTTLERADQMHELTQSLVEMERITRSKVNAFAFPYGTYNEELIHLAEDAGYRCAMTTEVELNDSADSNFLIHRWNVKRSTTLEEFRLMISGNGEIPRSVKTKSMLKHFARRLIGTEQIQQLKQFIKPASHG